MPMFGITPCPVTIFTFGLLLLTTPQVSRWLLPIPLLLSGIAVLLLVLRDHGRLPSAISA